jgi:hypothetical protein
MSPERSSWVVTSGQCPQCGADDWELVPSALPSRLVRWFNYGRHYQSDRVRCRACGFADAEAIAIGGRLVFKRTHHIWDIPGRMVSRTLARRSAMPVPRTYLMAALVGTALGVGLDLTVGWPWWAVALGFLIAVWLVFLSTAFWGGSGARVPGRR